MRRYVPGHAPTSPPKAQPAGTAWTIPHIEGGLGAIRLARLDREDVAAWINGLASGGKLSHRSVQICRTVLRAALCKAVDEGLAGALPSRSGGLPRSVAKPVEGEGGGGVELGGGRPFLAVTSSIDGRSASGWGSSSASAGAKSSHCAGTTSTGRRHPRIDESLVATKDRCLVGRREERTLAATVPLDPETVRALRSDPCGAGRRTTRCRCRVRTRPHHRDPPRTALLPRSYDRALARVDDTPALPRITSHGLRHTAATHMVAAATTTSGELRAIADLFWSQPRDAHEHLRACAPEKSERRGRSHRRPPPLKALLSVAIWSCRWAASAEGRRTTDWSARKRAFEFGAPGPGVRGQSQIE